MRLAELASRQHGVVALAQLRALGMDDGAVAYRVRVGRLHSLHRGVYAVGHRHVSDRGRSLAAVMAVGAGAVLSHVSAAHLWGFSHSGHGAELPVDVTVARRVRQRPGIRLHVVRRLDPRDTARHDGVPVTSPARTLLDLAEVLPGDRALRRAVHEAQVQRRVTERRLVAQLGRAAGRRGYARLAAIVGEGPAATRSELEDRTLELLLRHGFPRPQTNAVIGGPGGPVEVDLLFPRHRLIVESDGERYHATRQAHHEDARKQAMLEARGYRLVRVTWAQVTREAEQTVPRLRRALAEQAAPAGEGGAQDVEVNPR